MARRHWFVPGQATTFPNAGGRPVFLIDDREPVRELL
jgi:hypothetical protein